MMAEGQLDTIISATALAARACFHTLYCLDRVVFCSVKGPQESSDKVPLRTFASSFFSVFLVLFSMSLF